MIRSRDRLTAALFAVSIMMAMGGATTSVQSLAGDSTGAGVLAAAAINEEKLPPEIPAEKFGAYFKMVKPYPGEFRWREEIPWAGTIHEARERAAKEDKPILVWLAANSPCLGST